LLDDGREVAFDFLELDELQLAYALTVHKAQGSEFRACVVVLLTSHYVMLARNLVYTALTRARDLAVLLGQPAALGIAVRNNRVSRRYTGLARRLAEADPARRADLATPAPPAPPAEPTAPAPGGLVYPLARRNRRPPPPLPAMDVQLGPRE